MSLPLNQRQINRQAAYFYRLLILELSHNLQDFRGVLFSGDELDFTVFKFSGAIFN